MKKIYRYEDNKEYWDRRWTEAGEDTDSFTNMDIYPIKYAEMVMEPGLLAAEIGCGLGRVIKHYNNQGYNIIGIERSEVAVEKINQTNPELDVQVGDVLKLPYSDNKIDILMAFGLLHNLESGIEDALAEISRVLKTDGRFCISMRPDNLEMAFNEVYWRWKKPKQAGAQPRFHKLMVKEGEFAKMLAKIGLEVEQIHRSRNVSSLYRIPFFRSRSIEQGPEGQRRSAGYQLNAAGRFLDNILTRMFPFHTANVIIFIGKGIS